MMQRYHFEVLRDGAAIIASHSIALPNVAARLVKDRALGENDSDADEDNDSAALVLDPDLVSRAIETARRYADAFAT